MIMNWNYRLLDRTEENGDYPLIELVEVHYEDDGSLMGYCTVSCIADHIEEMRQTFAWYALALDKPVLKSSDFLILKSTEEDDDRQAELAVAILNDADVMQEFDNEVWVQIDKDSWNEFNGSTDDDEEEDDDA
jgi:hypothetical protein